MTAAFIRKFGRPAQANSVRRISSPTLEGFADGYGAVYAADNTHRD